MGPWPPPVQGGDGSGGRYADMFNAFFKKPDMVGTYKPVFLAGLVDIAAKKAGGPLDVGEWVSSGDDGRVRVDLNLAAVPFAKFYWDMLAGFGPRHTPVRMADDKSRSKDVVNIVKVINAEVARRKIEELRAAAPGGGGSAAGGEGSRNKGGSAAIGGKPPTLKELASDGMAGFRESVIKKSIKPEVVWHLAYNAPERRRNKGRQEAPPKRRAAKAGFGLYEYRSRENCIVLDAEAVEYMGRNEFTLRAALGELIDRHLEKNNPAARHIATMVNLNRACEAKSREVEKLACAVAPSQGDIDPLLGISLDLAAGLASLSRARA